MLALVTYKPLCHGANKNTHFHPRCIKWLMAEPILSIEMFARASALLLPVLALSSVVVAAPEPIAARGDGSSCSNGTLQCCGSTFQATQSTANLLGGLLGIVGSIPIVGPLLAINCSPIDVLGLGSGASCSQQAVCCQNTAFEGLVNVGCSNVNLGGL
ncbi:hypothetical protein SCLCIDRAFT_874552 [Scleroderma citrinum Foug A]|uniref:Hydrophobin n=1 Tax=Scleroderma citrinum Foug A TaxID=1036808 RepID=A0A0C3E065_9AGAM|nr:hypothetical protein SCLCIDRAFT_874552 [Scleroderma citrinum Foug A]